MNIKIIFRNIIRVGRSGFISLFKVVIDTLWYECVLGVWWEYGGSVWEYSHSEVGVSSNALVKLFD